MSIIRDYNRMTDEDKNLLNELFWKNPVKFVEGITDEVMFDYQKDHIRTAFDILHNMILSRESITADNTDYTTTEYELKKVQLFGNPKTGYWLNITYQYEDDTENVHEVIIKHIPLSIYPYYKNVTLREARDHGFIVNRSMDIGYGDVQLIPGEGLITDTITAPAVKEMTLKEIEEKLGHKVVIVADKEE